jgi:hypothetical protein
MADMAVRFPKRAGCPLGELWRDLHPLESAAFARHTHSRLLR